MTRITFKTLFCLVMLVTAGLTGVAEQKQKMLPLSEIVSEQDPNKFVLKISAASPDMSELPFIGERCAMLYMVLAAYYEQTGDSEIAESAKELKTRANTFLNVSVNLDMNYNKKSKKFLDEQLVVFRENYVNSLIDSKKLNNTIQSTLIVDDSKFAANFYPIFEALDRKMR